MKNTNFIILDDSTRNLHMILPSNIGRV